MEKDSHGTKQSLKSGLEGLYPGVPARVVRARLSSVRAGFKRAFGHQPGGLFSAPGRVELGGNHTDHQRGRVLAAAVALDDIAAAAPNGDGVFRIYSESYGQFSVMLDDLAPRAEDAGTPAALVRGVAEYLSFGGYAPSGGFDAYIDGRVPVGSGLSSSAAFEVLIAAIFSGLYFNGEIAPEQLARAGQYAENTNFGKPCGLMDQMASAAGGVLGLDFEDQDTPRLTRVPVDFEAYGYALCIIETGAGHDQLTDEYAAVPAEMTAVANCLGAERLREVAPARFYDALPALRQQVPDRALLRAMHFFDENARVRSQLDALTRRDFGGFLRLVRESGASSWTRLQNIYPSGAVRDQSAALALAWCWRLLGDAGACRIHGGGFGGTI